MNIAKLLYGYDFVRGTTKETINNGTAILKNLEDGSTITAAEATPAYCNGSWFMIDVYNFHRVGKKEGAGFFSHINPGYVALKLTDEFHELVKSDPFEIVKSDPFMAYNCLQSLLYGYVCGFYEDGGVIKISISRLEKVHNVDQRLNGLKSTMTCEVSDDGQTIVAKPKRGLVVRLLERVDQPVLSETAARYHTDERPFVPFEDLIGQPKKVAYSYISSYMSTDDNRLFSNLSYANNYASDIVTMALVGSEQTDSYYSADKLIIPVAEVYAEAERRLRRAMKHLGVSQKQLETKEANN